jgi:hypothetical protein
MLTANRGRIVHLGREALSSSRGLALRDRLAGEYERIAGMAGDDRQRRRDARQGWRDARARVEATSARLADAKDVVAANRELTTAVDEWERSRSVLERLVREADWLKRLAHKARLRRDDRLRATVLRAIARRKGASRVVKSRSADLPAHDWLKDAWR